MATILGIIQLLTILAIILQEYNRRSTSIFLWAMLFAIYSIPHFLTCLSAENEYSREILIESSLYTILFSATYMICRLFIKKRKEKPFDVSLEKSERKNHENITLEKILVILLIGSIIIRLALLASGSGGIMNTSWGSMRRVAQSETGLFTYSNIFTVLYFVGSTSLLLTMIEGKKKKALLLIILMLIEVIISRNRIEILPIMCSLMSIFVIKHKKIGIKVATVAVIALIVTIYSVYGLRVFRHYGTLSDFSTNFTFSDFNERINLYIRTDNGELGLKNHFYYFIQNNNNFENFNKGHTYIRMLLFLIPTSLSDDLKPPDFAISMGHAVDPTIKGYSVHPTLFGDCYANFGFWGFFGMGLFWGLFVSFFDMIIRKCKSNYLRLCFISIMAISYIIIGRGSVYNGFVWQAYSLIMIYITYKICRMLIKSQTKKSYNKKLSIPQEDARK